MDFAISNAFRSELCAKEQAIIAKKINTITSRDLSLTMEMKNKRNTLEKLISALSVLFFYKFHITVFMVQFLFCSISNVFGSGIIMPQIPLELGEQHILFIDNYFWSPNMNYSTVVNVTECKTPYIDITTPEIVNLREHIKIKDGFDQISSERSSQMIYFEAPNFLKQFYIGFFSNDLIFYLYNLTDFNEYTTMNNTIK